MITHPAGTGARRLEADFAAELAVVRPGLSERYAAALAGARAAVLGRLWRALRFEPLPGVRSRGPLGVWLADGRRVTGPERSPYDSGGEALLWLDGVAYTHPAALLDAIALPGGERLIAEVDNSVASLALSRAGAAAYADRQANLAGYGPRSPEYDEQSVVDGHPYHPCCRTRPGFSVAEQLAYLPEHRPVVALDLLAVPRAQALVSGRWPASLTDGDRLLLPVHPWQSMHVLPELGLRPYLAGAIAAHPQMSVRTLAPADGGAHVKTSLTTRLTSAVRDISAGSVRVAVPLSDLVAELSERFGGRLRVARYLAGAAAVTDAGPSADAAVLLREPPARFAGPGERVIPVAALTTRPVHGRELIHRLPAGRDPAGWLAAFARLAMDTTLGLLALGVGLEAHGQNLLVVVDGRGDPVRLVYRDLADVRLSPARLARAGVTPPPLPARLLVDDPEALRAKLFAALVGGTFGGLVATLGRGGPASEQALWAVVAGAARRAFDELPDDADTRADRAALFGPVLPVKALTLMRLDGTPPGDSWATLPNPLVGPAEERPKAGPWA
ncbi:IucA/IucC family siderophore biosynthesis protein [Nonomuraea sp. NN258]|uniref:IucA/IucC family protein n=1 Tax=Nonomuraea antri TaxID=2730852 RepID=UPI001569DCFD|nr:IucA/IucC family siderophore biosynthesis protein [Nonomuraea antri]NRQ38129.1 IucA/IucC family siderophore biosynthesis protein [Nonomuraea antri]